MKMKMIMSVPKFIKQEVVFGLLRLHRRLIQTGTIKKILIVFVVLNLGIMGGYVYFMADSPAIAETKTPQGKPAAASTTPASPEASWSALQQRQEELRIKEMELKTMEAQLDAKIKRLEELEALVKQDVATLKTLSDERIKQLVKMFSTMPPKSAAKLMDNTDMLVAVEIFHNMKGEIAGGILANMDPPKAATITKMLASYRAASKQPETAQ